MLSQTKYKITYAVYSFGISLLLLGMYYVNFGRLFRGPLLFRGLGMSQERNLLEIGIISAVVVIVCFCRIVNKGIWISLWKYIYGIVSAAIIFLIEYFMIVFADQPLLGGLLSSKILLIFHSVLVFAILFGLILFGLMLKWISGVRVLFDDEYEVTSAILISAIAVFVVTILLYTVFYN